MPGAPTPWESGFLLIEAGSGRGRGGGSWRLDPGATVGVVGRRPLLPAIVTLTRIAGAVPPQPPAGDPSIIVLIPVSPPSDDVGATGAGPSGHGDGLTVTVCRPSPAVGVVRAVGEIDMLTARRWASALADLGHQLAQHEDDPRRCGDRSRPGGNRRRLVCDLTGIEFFGASGLAVLAETAALAAGAGVALRLVADSRAVLRPLQLTAMDRQLCIDAHLLTAITHALRGRR